MIKLPPQAAICIRKGGGPSWGVASGIRAGGGIIVPLLIVLPSASSIRGCSGIVAVRLVAMIVLLLLLYIVPLLSVTLAQTLEL